MARNKYPEITISRILETAHRLFLEKGYEETTIQDIVNELGDLSKGAVYHHFKSKEDILEAVMDQMNLVQNPFDVVWKIPGLTGRERVRELLLISITNLDDADIYYSTKSLLKNPHFLARQIEEVLRVSAPELRKVIDTGVEDGSIQTEYPAEMAETALLLLNIWLSPALVLSSEERFMRKLQYLKDTFEKIGIPVIDDEIAGKFRNFYHKINSGRKGMQALPETTG